MPIQFKEIILPKVNSTNEWALQELHSGNITGNTIIQALDQTAGKGFGDNTWESEANKNITVSLVMKSCNIAPANQFLINQITSLALYDYLSVLVKYPDVSIKWPNDIYVGNKKIAGILIRNLISGDKIEWVVVGIGVNINQKKFLSKAPNPISLRMITGLTHDIMECKEAIISAFANRYSMFENGFNEKIKQDYQNVMFRIDKLSPFLYKGEPIWATIKGTGEFGHLIIVKDDGEQIYCDLKEIEYRLDD